MIKRVNAGAGISHTSVQRIWRAHGLKPHLIETFKISRDKNFATKVADVVGLYLDPPDKALVLCVDEKSQIQALDRTQPGLPMKKGRAGTMIAVKPSPRLIGILHLPRQVTQLIHLEIIPKSNRRAHRHLPNHCVQVEMNHTADTSNNQESRFPKVGIMSDVGKSGRESGLGKIDAIDPNQSSLGYQSVLPRMADRALDHLVD